MSSNYSLFVEKFNRKKTSDDCYTPENIYDAVVDWVEKEYHVDKKCFVRPFYPDMEYTEFNYPPGSIVVDNPPFSILRQITSFYEDKNIKFFLFAPALTLLHACRNLNVCAIPVGVEICFENKATINIGFITNLENDCILRSAPDLYLILKDVNKKNLKKQRRENPKYDYPDAVVHAAKVQFFSAHGVNYRLDPKDCIFVDALDAQRSTKKSIFGGGFLLTEKAAAEKAAAEKAAAKKWTLSFREKETILFLEKMNKES